MVKSLMNEPEDYGENVRVILYENKIEIWVISASVHPEWLLHGSWKIEDNKVSVSAITEILFLLDNGFGIDFRVG